MKVRKDPKGKAKQTQVHRDRTKYYRPDFQPYDDDLIIEMVKRKDPSTSPEQSEGDVSGCEENDDDAR